MKSTLSLFKKRGILANVKDIAITFFIPLGVIYTIIQIFESISSFKVEGIFLVYILLSLFIGVILFIFFRTHSLLSKTIKLSDNYQITISVEDYTKNAKDYPTATCVTGINDQFDLDESIKTSLVHAITDELLKGEYDETFKENFEEKIANNEKFGLDVAEISPLNKKVFKHGSIISDKFIFETNKRNILFFANSEVVSKGEFIGKKKTASALKLIWSYLHKSDIKAVPLLMPLLGTGFSRDTSPMSATITIIDQFFAISYARTKEDLEYSQLVPHLIISIQPEMIIKNEVDLEAVHKYIEVMHDRLDYAFTKDILYRKNIEDTTEQKYDYPAKDAI